MYRPHFEAAARFVRSIGLECSLNERQPFGAAELGTFGARLGGSLPRELADYFAELGDGFSIQWEIGDWHQSGQLFAAGLSFLDDIASEYAFMQENLGKIAASPDASEVLRTEAKRRMTWVPIMDVGEGCYIFCLDATASSNRITYYDSSWATYAPERRGASIADSLLDLVGQWSRFCFSDPVTPSGEHISLDILADGLNGPFDWHPRNFAARFDRGTIKA